MENEDGNLEGFNLLFQDTIIPEIGDGAGLPERPAGDEEEQEEETPEVPEKKEKEKKPEEEEESEEEEEEEEPETPPEKKKKEEEEEEESEEDNLKIIAEHLSEQGILTELDEEFDSSDEAFSGLIEKTVEAKFSKYKDSLTNETSKSFLEYLENGGSPENFIQAYSGTDYTKLDDEALESESNQKQIISELLALEGLEPDEIKETLEDYEEGGIMEKQAGKALKRLQRVQTQQREQLVESQKKQKEIAIEQHQEYLNGLQKDIEKREEIAGFQFKNKKEKTDFFEYITKIDVKSGKTSLQKEIEADADSQLKMAWLYYNKFNFDKLKEKAKSEATKSLKQKLNSSRGSGSSKTVSKKRKVSEEASDFSLFRKVVS